MLRANLSSLRQEKSLSDLLRKAFLLGVGRKAIEPALWITELQLALHVNKLSS